MDLPCGAPKDFNELSTINTGAHEACNDALFPLLRHCSVYKVLENEFSEEQPVLFFKPPKCSFLKNIYSS